MPIIVISSFTIAAISLLALVVMVSKYFALKSALETKYFAADSELRSTQAELRSIQGSFDDKLKMQMSDWSRQREVEIRRDAIDRSKAVIVGKVTEHVVPYFPQFKYNPKDARFMGSPLDFVIFDGLDEGCLRRIVLVEVKTGAANLNTRTQYPTNGAPKAGRVCGPPNSAFHCPCTCSGPPGAVTCTLGANAP